MGATDTVDWIGYESATAAVLELKEKGYKIYGVEQTAGSITLQKFVVPAGDKIALVFGNEVEGVSSDVLHHVDGCIEIPQMGMKHSLNISVAAGIVLWEVVRERIGGK